MSIQIAEAGGDDLTKSSMDYLRLWIALKSVVQILLLTLNEISLMTWNVAVVESNPLAKDIMGQMFFPSFPWE